MTTLFFYILAASGDPDNVECTVPYLVDDLEIFFGPCKRLLRQELRVRYLKTSNDVRLEEDIFLVGVNGYNPNRSRKIVWAGRVTLMTFETAYKKLTHEKYRKMRELAYSPLHVNPIYGNNGKFRGYEHCSNLHEVKDSWVRDFCSMESQNIEIRAKQLILRPNAERHQVFPRDCCFLLENVFFANGQGIAISKEILEILKNAQDKKLKIDEYAIFGYRKDGSVNGLTGRWLEVLGEDATMFMHLIKSKIPTSNEKLGQRYKFQSRRCTCN